MGFLLATLLLLLRKEFLRKMEPNGVSRVAGLQMTAVHLPYTALNSMKFLGLSFLQQTKFSVNLVDHDPSATVPAKSSSVKNLMEKMRTRWGINGMGCCNIFFVLNVHLSSTVYNYIYIYYIYYILYIYYIIYIIYIYIYYIIYIIYIYIYQLQYKYMIHIMTCYEILVLDTLGCLKVV